MYIHPKSLLRNQRLLCNCSNCHFREIAIISFLLVFSKYFCLLNILFIILNRISIVLVVIFVNYCGMSISPKIGVTVVTS